MTAESALPTLAEIDTRMQLALDRQFRQLVMVMLAMHAFSVSLMATLFLFLQG